MLQASLTPLFQRSRTLQQCWSACWFFLGVLLPMGLSALPLETEILDHERQPLAQAQVYIDYVEIHSLQGELLGRVGLLNRQGRVELFLVQENDERALVGWAGHNKLYNQNDQLIAVYGWTSFWSYTYTPDGKKLGQAKCLAYRGACSVGIAGYLSGLFTRQPE